MRFKRFAFGITLFFSASFAATALTTRANETAVELTLATGSPGGTFHAVGAELARVLSSVDAGLAVATLESSGSIENLRLLANGKADIALATEDALMAYRKKTNAGPSDPPAPCVLGPLYVGAAQFVLRADQIRSGTLSDLEGVRLYPGARGSGTEEATELIMDALSIRPHYVAPINRTLGYEEAAAALARGAFDAATLSGGLPVTAISTLFSEHANRFRILDFSPRQQSKILESVSGLHASTVPPLTYPGQDEAIRSVGKLTLLVARGDAPAETIDAIVQRLESVIPELSHDRERNSIHPALRSLTLEFWRSPLQIARCAGARR